MFIIEVLVMFGCAVFFLRAAQAEGKFLIALLWFFLSLGLWSVTSKVLGWGLLGSLLGQVGFGLVVTMNRMRKLKTGSPKSDEASEEEEWEEE